MGDLKNVQHNKMGVTVFLLFIFEIANGYPQPNLSSPIDSAITMPAIARKAGGNWRPELLESASPDSGFSTADTTKEVGNDNETKEVKEEEDDYSYEEWDGYNSSEEKKCSGRMFFHVRGKKCVPLRCPEDTKRNQKTGDCEIEPYYNYQGFYWAPSNSHYRTGGAVFRSKIYRPRVWRGRGR